MANEYNKPFDNRLTVLVGYRNQDAKMHVPYSGKVDSIGSSFYMSLDTIESKRKALEAAGVNVDNVKKRNAELIDAENAKVENATQHSVINPYAMIRLSGGVSSTIDRETRLIDSSKYRPWYEIPNTTDNSDMGYSKVPTTSRIIEWGRTDSRGRTPYQYQDFVFCKHWNKIPNNRLITLRRYAQPILDNLNTPADNVESENDGNSFQFPPLATAVTYFGEGTDNSLTDILKFKTALKWGETQADVWDMSYASSGAQSTNDVLGGAMGVWGGLGAAFGGGMADALNALSIYNGKENPNGLLETNGLGPDPYENGPYENRIKGPVNRIDTVKRREAGMEFEMGGMEIKFHYVARPIGGINSKAILLDILSNFMIMGSASAVFFGGAHRFRSNGRRFPAGNQRSIKDLYKGRLFGENGAVKSYVRTFTDFYKDAGGFSSIVGNLFESAKALINNIVNAFGGANPFSASRAGQNLAGNIETAVVQKMHTGMSIPYIQGMRALLVGEPVGDWHLTIGNPLNPIAMIGNLICTGVEVEFNEEAGLGPDDFPLEFTITVSLEHGMPRDRDGIESMFNRGNGRIYELPDRFNSSGDYETSVDEQTGSRNKNQGKIMNSYATTRTSSTPVTKDIATSQDHSVIHTSANMNNTNLKTVGFSNINSLETRVPYHPGVEWITKKAFK